MKKYILNDSKKIIFLKNNEILVETKKCPRLKLDNSDYNSLTDLCKKYTIFEKNSISEELFSILYKNKIIIEANFNIKDSYKTKYERNELFAYNFFCKKTFKSIIDKKVLFIGVGGIASIIIDQLISVGIENFSIVDFDKVDLSNLNRQFVYKENDVGLYKVELFKNYVLSKNSHAKIKIYNMKIETSNQINEIVKNDKIDFIVNSADTPPCYLQKYIVESSLKLKVPCIFGGVGIEEGSYGPLLDSSISKINYLKQINSTLDKINYYFPCKSSFGVTNSIISNYMAWDIIMYMMNEKKYVKSLNKSININFKGTKHD